MSTSTAPRPRIYVGLAASGTTQPLREVFLAAAEPTYASHGHRYAAVIGPFRTARGAAYMVAYGAGNPHIQSVADAERLAHGRAR